MKKYTILASILALTGCATYHNGKMGMNFTNPEIEFAPKQVNVNIDAQNKISGSAKCTSVLWAFNSTPVRQTYGPELQTNDGNIAPDECVAGALYDAMSKSNADIIVAPQYTVAHKGILCFKNKCLHGSTQVIVSGYAGTITSIKDMDQSVVQEKQKATFAK